MKNILKKILSKNNEVLLPLSIQEIDDFEKYNDLRLPKDYIELLNHFDGGEILIPGPIIFGIKENEMRKTIKEVNGKSFRKNFSIPDNYLIIGKLNYGDLICINLNKPNDVLQWDHENNERFCSWDNLFDWLNDNFSSYETFEEKN